MPETWLKYNVDPATINETKPIDYYLSENQMDTAKQLIKQRIANVIHTVYSDNRHVGAKFTHEHPSAFALTKDSVYLYPQVI
jgi:hypothetical protein